jgi:ABC-2 type transport system ATP-binding protein
VLLLDEPTSAMDPESARVVRDAIHGLRNQDVTIVLCSHNLVEAEELADMVAIIQRGRIIYNGTVGNLKHTLLGQPEFEARVNGEIGDWQPDFLPEGVSITGRGQDWMRFKVDAPEVSNPMLIEQMGAHQLKLVTFQEVPHSLEMAYLEAVNKNTGKVRE